VRHSILFDARLVLEQPTGIGRYVTSLLPPLCEAAPDWTFHVLRRPAPWPGYGLAEWAAPNVTHHVSTLRHMSFAQHVVLPRLARKLGVDLLHYPHFDAPVIGGGVPVIATIHDVKHATLRGLFPRFDALKRWYLTRLLESTLRRAAAVIADSEATAAEARLVCGAAARLRVVPLAPDRTYRPAAWDTVLAFRKRYALERPYVLCVSEFRPHKNHARLVRAFAESRGAAAHDLVLVGQRHSLDEPPERWADEAGIASRVHVLTDVSSEDLVAAYTGADLFALVSLHEGFGLPILEAMACGAPVVTSRTTAAGEVAGDGALLVDPESESEIVSALDAVLGNRAEGARLRDAGFARSKQFTWEEAARRTLAVYDEVLSSRVRP
jgi:glycosyltransferase involved in cell wall biosynthesis